MLAVLAIIGIITVSSISVFQKLLSKRQANAVIHDAQVAYIEGNAFPCDVQYHRVEILSDVQVSFEIYCDQKKDRYIRVSDISNSICREVLWMSKTKMLNAYAQDFIYEPGCDRGRNVMIFAFNETPAPALSCTYDEDCPDDFGWTCKAGICKP